MFLTGHDIKVYIGETPILLGHAKSCTINLMADEHETTSATDGTARSSIAGRTGWEVTVSKLVFYMRHDLLRIGKTFTLTMGVDGTDKLTGTAICTQSQLMVQEGNLVKCSVRFLGSGALA